MNIKVKIKTNTKIGLYYKLQRGYIETQLIAVANKKLSYCCDS